MFEKRETTIRRGSRGIFLRLLKAGLTARSDIALCEALDEGKSSKCRGWAQRGHAVWWLSVTTTIVTTIAGSSKEDVRRGRMQAVFTYQGTAHVEMLRPNLLLFDLVHLSGTFQGLRTL